MIPDVTIEHVAAAILAADKPASSGWSKKPPEMKEHYRKLARAAIEAQQPDDPSDDSFVGVACGNPSCSVGGYYPPGCYTPIDDDGHELTYVEGPDCFFCHGCLEEHLAAPE